jgi:hypothetical protein
MSEPQIIIGGNEGFHNLEGTPRPYRDLSTICVIPTRGVIPARVVERYMALMPPMNQPFTRMFVSGMEVGAAYNSAIETILAHPDLSKWKYVLTLEEDNLPPPDGLLRLLDAIYEREDFAAVSGLYWTKGEGGQPMIYGKPGGVVTFEPFLPPNEDFVECCGIGMGFAVWHLDVFRDPKFEKPWFLTQQQYDPYSGAKAMTQDLFACAKLKELGYRFAVDTTVKVGHLDSDGRVW